MKNFKKTFAVILAGIMTVGLLASCGGKKVSKEDQQTMEGKWNMVLADMYDVKMKTEDLDTQMAFEFKGNKATYILDGETETYDWEKDDTLITIWVPDGPVKKGHTAVLEDNYFTLYWNLDGTPVKLIFAKEGTDAENAQNYIKDGDITLDDFSNATEENVGELLNKLSPEAIEKFGLTEIKEQFDKQSSGQ